MIGIEIKKFPNIEVITMIIKGISVKIYAHGIEPLNSVMGSIASINVVVMWLFEMCSIYGINVSATNYLELV